MAVETPVYCTNSHRCNGRVAIQNVEHFPLFRENTCKDQTL